MEINRRTDVAYAFLVDPDEPLNSVLQKLNKVVGGNIPACAQVKTFAGGLVKVNWAVIEKLVDGKWVNVFGEAGG